MDAVDIVKSLLKSRKASQKDLAKFIGMNASHLSDALKRKGRYIPSDKIVDIAKYFNTTTDHILGIEPESKSRVRIIPLIGLASCGTPHEYDLDGFEPVAISEDIYEDGMYAVQAEGESMSPKINHGSIVYCNVNRRIENGSIVHYSLDGESGIKRYKINERGDIISLVPINSNYDRMELKMARVVGAVDTDF